MVNRDDEQMTRAEFLKLSGSALVAGAVAGVSGPAAAGPTRAVLSESPNVVLIMTDQSRYPQHWPDGWEQANLPADQRLAAHGLSFSRFFANAAMCSPSRACLFTGLFPLVHGVVRTLTYGGAVSDEETPLSSEITNLATMFAESGYHTVLKGKWHLSKHSDGGAPDEADLQDFGFFEWDPTTAGEGPEVEDFGGGCAGHDVAIADSAVAFLENWDPSSGPFALIVSFANPHDVIAYPRTWDEDDGQGCDNYGSSAVFAHNIEVPPSFTDDLSTKPTCQAQSRQMYAVGLGALNTPQERLEYVNFYADLQILVDSHISRVLDALDAASMTDDTIVVRTSDHGEMGLAHGGLRQKMFNAYEETIRLPLIISNPVLFPEAQTTDALASMVDLLPTLANLIGAPAPLKWERAGVDLSPVLSDPDSTVQDAVLFTFDDEQAGTPNGQSFVTQPNHIRALRIDAADGSWKIARTFDPSPDAPVPEQLELYYLTDGSGQPVDPLELNNLADPENPDFDLYSERRLELYERLRAEEGRASAFFRDGFESGDTLAWD